MSILTIGPVLKAIIYTIGFCIAFLIPGILTMCLATLRAKKPIKDVLDSDKLKDICNSQGLLLFYGYPKNKRKTIRFIEYVKTAMMLLVVGAGMGLLLRFLFDHDRPFWVYPVAIEVTMMASIIFTMVFFVDTFADRHSWHVWLLAIPAALLGGLIACI